MNTEYGIVVKKHFEDTDEDIVLGTSGELFKFEKDWCYGDTQLNQQEDLIAEQFTFIDSNKTKIYEGDILKHPSGQLFIVRWDVSYCGLRAFYHNSESSSSIALQINERGLAVVFGNIHEDSSLVKLNFDFKAVHESAANDRT